MTRSLQKAAAVAVGLVVAAGLAAGAWFALAPTDDDPFAGCRATRVAAGAARIGGEFTLVSETGATMTAAEIIDGLTLVNFGYTWCPDVCPLDAARNAEVASILAAEGIALRTVFITVDPERDTPEVVAAFTDLFDPAMLGFTGSAEQVEAAKRAFLVYSARNGTGEDYLVDHSTFSYLMAPEAGFLELYRHEQDAAGVAASIACFAGALKSRR
jgi:protein SCO1/2